MEITEIIREVAKNKINIEVEWNGETLVYLIHGFYKSGVVRLFEKEGNIVATDRYHDEHFVDSVRDLVYLNYKWWRASKDRFDGWASPDSSWVGLLKECDFIKEITETIIRHE
jgi:hypothetical protein